MAKYSEAQKKAVAKYNAKAYDEIKTRVPKGKKEVLQAIAKEQGISLNSYTKQALQAKIKADTGVDIELCNFKDKQYHLIDKLGSFSAVLFYLRSFASYPNPAENDSVIFW